MAVFPPKTEYVDVPDPANPPVGATEVTAEWLNDLQDYVLELPVTTDIDGAVLVGQQNTLIVLFFDGTLWPLRPDTSATNQHILWVGPAASPIASGGTSTGGTRARAPFDLVAYS